MNRKYKFLQLCLVIVITFFLASCRTEVNGQPEPRPAPENMIETGRGIIASYGCGSCHTIPWVPGADAKAGPPLVHFFERSYIAGRLSNNSDNLMKWIVDPQQVEPGTAMPTLGVSVDEAEAIAAYLYHQATVLDLINR